jgi:hypothetical protein
VEAVVVAGARHLLALIIRQHQTIDQQVIIALYGPDARSEE